MTRPFVSLGLPVYNAERYLAACLDSLLGQEYPRFELIIADNASTDGTAALCEAVAGRDARVRFVRGERNRGGSWNHNRVLALAGGEYFKWCGADDRCHPWFVRACVDALEASPGAVLAYPRSVVIDERDCAVARTTTQLPVDSPDVVERFASLLGALSVTQNVFYGMYRRASLRRAGPHGAFLAADRCLLGRLALLGPFVPIADFLMYRRQHAGNQRTQIAEQCFYNPTDRAAFRPREWRVLWEQLRSIVRAPLSARTKLRLLGAVARWAHRQRADLASEGRGVVGQLLRRWA